MTITFGTTSEGTVTVISTGSFTTTIIPASGLSGTNIISATADTQTASAPFTNTRP